MQEFHDLCNFTLRIYQVFDNSSGKKPKMSETFDMPHLWWERDDLGYRITACSPANKTSRYWRNHQEHLPTQTNKK